MGRKKLYANAAEKQKAWRERHGQKRKVPLEIRRGEELGSSETTIRQKREGETWEEYHEYLTKAVTTARRREQKAGGGKIRIPKPGGVVIRSEFGEDYYETRYQYEKGLEELGKGGKIKKNG